MEPDNKSSLIVIMAGGLGKRMNSSLPKVLHRVFNRPMLIHVITSAMAINPYRICIIVGKYRKIIEETVNKSIEDGTLHISSDKIEYIDQPEALGTGHAVMCCNNYIQANRHMIDNIVILSGDVPFIKSDTIGNLSTMKTDIAATILVANLENPYGYGRIILSDTDSKLVVDIAEERDCNPDQKLIKLINGGIYCFNCDVLMQYIDKISNNNSQQEYYLTEIFRLMTNDSNKISYKLLCEDEIIEITGVNTPDQLRELEAAKDIRYKR